jgi:hypothetical protein
VDWLKEKSRGKPWVLGTAVRSLQKSDPKLGSKGKHCEIQGTAGASSLKIEDGTPTNCIYIYIKLYDIYI